MKQGQHRHNNNRHHQQQRNRGNRGGGGGGRPNNGGGNPINRVYESNGPDVKVRGSAQTIAEKYQQLARDAHSAGDRVLAESYHQHAEHYLRILAAAQAFNQQQASQQQQWRRSQEDGAEEDGEISEANEGEMQADDNDDDLGNMSQPDLSHDTPPMFSPAPSREAREPREPREPRHERQDRRFQDRRERAPRQQDEQPESPEDGWTGPQPSFF